MAADGFHDEGVFRVACNSKRSDAIEQYIAGSCLLSPVRLREFAPDAYEDSAIPAKLVKRFFRAMPEGGLIPISALVKVSNHDESWFVVSVFHGDTFTNRWFFLQRSPELAANSQLITEQVPNLLAILDSRRRGVFLWLLDWLVRVSPVKLVRIFPSSLASEPLLPNHQALAVVNKKSTRMDANNLAIVFGPNLYEQKEGEAVDPSTAIKYSKMINEFTKMALLWRMETNNGK